MRLAPVALAALLVLAGCSGAFGSATPTASPAPVPTASPTATPAPELAAGLTARGVVDPRRLAAAHLEALARGALVGASYTLRTTEVERYPDGTGRRRVETRHRVAGHRSYHRVAWEGQVGQVFGPGRAPARRGRAETYCESGRCLLAVTTRATNYREGLVLGPGFATATDPDRLGRLLSVFGTRVTGSRRVGGERHYRVVATSVREPAALAAHQGVASVRNASFEALVSSSGLVREYRLAYTAVGDGRRVRVVRTARFVAVGNTTLDRPPWYGAARNATGRGET